MHIGLMIGMVLMGFMSMTVRATDYFVSTNGGNQPPFTNWAMAATTLGPAVDLANTRNAGDTVWVSNGTHFITVTVPVSNIVVRGFDGNRTNTVVNGGNAVRCFMVNHSNALVTALTISNGNAFSGSGGGVSLLNGMVSNCIVSYCKGTNGGGVYTTKGVLANCRISNNSVIGGDGNGGGGVYMDHGGEVRSCLITLNETKSAHGAGGGIYANYGGTIRDSTISYNFAQLTGAGGGAQLYFGGLITNCIINNNYTVYGGGVRLSRGGQVLNCEIYNNRATAAGGGIYGYCGGAVAHCVIRNNTATVSGGGLTYQYDGTVANCDIRDNSAGQYGGGAQLFPGAVLQNCLIYRNIQNGATNWTSTFGDGGVCINANVAGIRKASGAYLPRLDGVNVKSYDVQGSNFQYGVKIVVRNDSALDGTVEIAVEDHPLAGNGATITAALHQAGQAATETNMVMPISDMGARWVRVALKVGGEEWESLSLKDIASLRAMRAYLDRNYYTTEETGWVIGEFGLPEETLKEKMLKVVGDGGVVLGETPAVITTKVRFPLKGLKEGRTKLAVELADNDGRTICRQELICVKRPPKPGFEWKNDRENRVLLRDGKPFFLRAINMCFDRLTIDMDSALGEMKATGFNAIMFAKDYIDPTNTVCLDLAQKHDLLVIPWMDNYCARRPRYNGGTVQLKCCLYAEYAGFEHMTREEKTKLFADEFHYQLPRMLETARRLKEHPGFLAYYIFDEPVEKRIFDQMTPGHEFYQALIEADGYHPVTVNYAGTIPQGDEYVDWCDVLTTDQYVAPPSKLHGGGIATTWRRADLNRNPIWIILCAEIFSGSHKRAIAPQEQLCQTYLALINGTKGLLYFTYPFRFQFSVDNFKAVNEQVQALAPIVLAPAVRQTVRYDPGEFDPATDKYPDVQAALFRHPQGGFVLLAANSRPYPVDVEYTVSLLGKSGNVKRLFADDTYRVKDGKFKDKIETHGVRAYEIRGQGSEVRDQQSEIRNQKSTIQIAVAMTAHPEAVTPEPPAIPQTGRVGKKNLVQNPGFELVTLPGAPDYFSHGPANLNGPRCGQPGAWFELDTRQPYEGKYALKLTCGMSNSWNSATFYLAPRTDSPVPVTYVFSAYMRADHDGVEASLSSDGAQSGQKPAKLVLTKEWKRYYERITLPAKVMDYNSFAVGVKFGTIWVDALQVELGTEPTDYEP